MDSTEYLTRDAAADHAGVGVRTIDKWLKQGKLTTYRAEGKHRVFVDREELDQLRTPTAA